MLGTAFRLAQENAVDMIDHFFGVQHGRNATREDSLAPFVVFLGNGPTPFHLCGKHHRERHKVALLVKIDRLHIFIGKGNIDIFRQSGGKSYGAMRRQVECRLARQFVPLRINEFQFDCIHFILLKLQKYKKINQYQYLLILRTMTLAPTNASTVCIAVSETPHKPCMLTFCPVKNKFLTFVKTDIWESMILWLSFRKP